MRPSPRDGCVTVCLTRREMQDRSRRAGPGKTASQEACHEERTHDQRRRSRADPQLSTAFFAVPQSGQTPARFSGECPASPPRRVFGPVGRAEDALRVRPSVASSGPVPVGGFSSSARSSGFSGVLPASAGASGHWSGSPPKTRGRFGPVTSKPSAPALDDAGPNDIRLYDEEAVSAPHGVAAE